MRRFDVLLSDQTHPLDEIHGRRDPGEPRECEPVRWPSVLLLVVLPGVLLYPCLSFHLFEPDEGRYAEIPREMLQRGEWVVPLLQGEPYLDKPPLFYWLVMLSYQMLGVADWTARLVPALAVHGCILLVYLFGRRSVGERAALWGALTLMLAPAFIGLGRLLLLDGVLAFFVTLSLLSAREAVRGPDMRRNWWLLAALACGLGVLTKGPVAVVLVLPPVVAEEPVPVPAQAPPPAPAPAPVVAEKPVQEKLPEPEPAPAPPPPPVKKEQEPAAEKPADKPAAVPQSQSAPAEKSEPAPASGGRQVPQ